MFLNGSIFSWRVQEIFEKKQLFGKHFFFLLFRDLKFFFVAIFFYSPQSVAKMWTRKFNSPSATRHKARVARMGEFSPFGRLFTLGSVFENYRSSPKFWATCFYGTRFLTKKWFGYILGDFSKSHLATLHKFQSHDHSNSLFSVPTFRYMHRHLRNTAVSWFYELALASCEFGPLLLHKCILLHLCRRYLWVQASTQLLHCYNIAVKPMTR
jgi:hypothetical protein